ncbi:excalibur calcium-binding domain-containing protein [Xanthomonas sp. CFBP 8445]|uniref:excalibur calcium-binding domain-containing protein n=1 Tax=Xanthomonas sp. CFBP 8445 TaxID=2971236 RepID=UPI0021E0E454|nr:excalibur calcium-binding domain-containing protein [Xanthomonas sp. CFBP 8445]UYC14290.1 excalibur calcium-binding domain-containing protein [Xanthomonas sp. CFBP 8445]
MTSCAEAVYVLQHCPGVEMDGNHDGVPCERQWCRRARRGPVAACAAQGLDRTVTRPRLRSAIACR